jgi:hypothetical protein
VDEFAPLLDRGNSDAVGMHVSAVCVAQRQLWRVRWDETCMMLYWRLVLNGVACCERSRQQPGECVCVALGLAACQQVGTIMLELSCRSFCGIGGVV